MTQLIKEMITGMDLTDAIKTGECTWVIFDIEPSADTALLFDDKYFGFRYDGPDIDDDTHDTIPTSPHYIEELCDSESTLMNHNNGYTERYYCIGHCPFGTVGDTLDIDGVPVEILEVDVREPNTAKDKWQWGVRFKNKSGV